jgi:hypothetical protein
VASIRSNLGIKNTDTRGTAYLQGNVDVSPLGAYFARAIE